MDLVESKHIYLLFAYLTKNTLIPIDNNVKYKIVTILKCFPMTRHAGKRKTVYRRIPYIGEHRLSMENRYTCWDIWVLQKDLQVICEALYIRAVSDLR